VALRGLLVKPIACMQAITTELDQHKRAMGSNASERSPCGSPGRTMSRSLSTISTACPRKCVWSCCDGR
jgi:hypothetical protein